MPFWIDRTFYPQMMYFFIMRLFIQKVERTQRYWLHFRFIFFVRTNKRKHANSSIISVAPFSMRNCLCAIAWCLPCDTLRKRKCMYVHHTWTCTNRMNHFFCYYVHTNYCVKPISNLKVDRTTILNSIFWQLAKHH